MSLFSMWIVCLGYGVISQFVERVVFLPGEVIQISDKQLMKMLNQDLNDTFILFYQDNDLLTPNVLKNVTDLAKNLESNLKLILNFARIPVKSAKKSLKKLKLKSFPCAIFIKSGKFYVYTDFFTIDSLTTFIVNDGYLSTPTYKVPKTLTFPQVISDIYTKGIKGNMTLILNLLFIFAVLAGLVYYLVHYYFNKPSKPKTT